MRFPRLHIAESVVNRILNVSESLQDQQPTTVPPVLPDPNVAGAAIDEALGTPQPELPAIGDAPDPGATLSGDPLMRTVLKPGR